MKNSKTHSFKKTSTQHFQYIRLIIGLSIGLISTNLIASEEKDLKTSGYQTTNLSYIKTEYREENVDEKSIANRPRNIFIVHGRKVHLDNIPPTIDSYGIDTTPYFGKATNKNLLSLDGGGIRGVMQLYTLMELEKKTGRYTADIFNVIAGTSIGALIACALTLPDPYYKRPKYSAREILDYVFNVKDEFFKTNYWSFFGLFGPLYKEDSLRGALHKFFGKNLLNERTKPTLLTTYDISLSGVRCFVSTEDEEKFLTSDVCMAAVAIPFGFPTQILKPNNAPLHKGYALIDGGMGANDPVVFGLNYLQKLYTKIDLRNNVTVLSLGTGTINNFETLEHTNHGIITLIHPILDELVKGQSSINNLFLANFISKNNYYRWDPVLPRSLLSFDDTSTKNINALLNAAEKQMLYNQNEFMQITDALNNYKTDTKKQVKFKLNS